MRFSHHPPHTQIGLRALLMHDFGLTLSPIQTHNRISLSPPLPCTPQPLHAIPLSYTKGIVLLLLSTAPVTDGLGQPHDYGFLIRAVEHRSCKKRMRASSSNHLCIPMPAKLLSTHHGTLLSVTSSPFQHTDSAFSHCQSLAD
jgi:hypothetical protein